MAVAWDAVRAVLAANLPAVVGASVTVYDGPVVSGDAPASYLTVADQPSSPDVGVGSFEQEVGPDGFSAAESGAILCELAAVTGDTTIPSVFATFDAIATWLQGNQTLKGTLTPASTVTAGAEVLQAQTTDGAVQRLLITVSYTTRI